MAASVSAANRRLLLQQPGSLEGVLGVVRQLRRLSVLLIFAGWGLLLTPDDAGCEYYHYIDRSGNHHFVDDPGKIPPEYAESLKIHKERHDNLNAEQKARLRAREALQEQINRERLQEQLAKEKERARIENLRKVQAERERYAKQLETEVIIQDNRILVPVQVGYNGREIKALLLLDTGASITVLHHASVASLNLQSKQKYKAQVAGGRLIPSYRVELGYLQVGPIRMSQAPAMVINHQGPAVAHDGLLGMNFLRQVHYTIDFENKRIKWQP